MAGDPRSVESVAVTSVESGGKERPILAALLALAASCSWGSSDFIGGLQSRRRSVWSVNVVSQPAAIVASAVALLVDWQAPADLASGLAPALGGIAGGIAIVAYYQALVLGAMSVVAPIAATGALVPVVAGLAWGERPAVTQYVGIACAVIGIVLISRSEGGDGVERVSLASVALALVAALGFGTMLIGFKFGEDDPYWAVFDARLGSALIVGLYLLLRRPRLNVTLAAVPVLASVGVLLVIANTLFTVATSQGYLSVVGVLGSLAPVVTIAIARSILAERLTRAQWVAAGTVLVGVVLLAIG